MTEKRNNDLNVPTLRFPGFDGEWTTVRLGDLVNIQSGFAFKSEGFTDNGIKLVIPKNFTKHGFGNFDHSISKFSNELPPPNYKCRAGDLLILLTDLTPSCELLGKPLLIKEEDGEVWLNQRIIRLDTNSTLSKRWLLYFLQTNGYHKVIKETASGSTVRHSSNKIINDMILSLPTIEEQEKISSVLQSIDDRILTQNKIIEQLESLIKAIGQVLFNQDRYEFNHFKLGEICEIKKGEQINGSELTEFGKYPVINGGITPSGFHSKYNCNAETITISEGGNSCGFVQFNKDPFWSGGHCYSLNSVKAFVLNKYLFYYLKYSESKIMSLRVGSGLPNIQRNAICNFEVLIPNEQTQILSTKMLDAIYEKRSYEIVLLNLFKNQKQYLLSSMFK